MGAMNASCSVHPKCVEQSLSGLCCPNNVIKEMMSCCNASGSQGAVSEIASAAVENVASTSASNDGGEAAGTDAPADALAVATAAATTAGPADATTALPLPSESGPGGSGLGDEETTVTSVTTTMEVGYDCSTEEKDDNWKTAWSDTKKTWCCEHEQVHCEVTQTSTTVTADLGILCGSIYCQSDAVCCSNLNGGALCGSPGSTCCEGKGTLFGGDAPLVLCANTSKCCNGVCLAPPPPGRPETPCLPEQESPEAPSGQEEGPSEQGEAPSEQDNASTPL